MMQVAPGGRAVSRAPQGVQEKPYTATSGAGRQNASIVEPSTDRLHRWACSTAMLNIVGEM